jgi:hypothetical protein
VRRIVGLRDANGELNYPARSRPPPKLKRDRNRIEIGSGPPRGLVAIAMQFAMMQATNRNGVFVADFPPKRTGLRKAKVMCFGGGTAANDTRLPCDEFAMLLVAQADRLPDQAASTAADLVGSNCEDV